jgi:hypothetical protein
MDMNDLTLEELQIKKAQLEAKVLILNRDIARLNVELVFTHSQIDLADAAIALKQV